MNLNFKWQRNSIDIFPKKMYKWPTVTWKDAQQALLIIREMQIKTKMRYDLTSVRIGTIKITDKWGCGERESTIGRNANQYSHYGKHYEGFSKNLKQLENERAIPLLVTYLKEIKSLYQRGICTPMFPVALLTIAKTWRQVSIDKWMDNMCPSTHMCTENVTKPWKGRKSCPLWCHGFKFYFTWFWYSSLSFCCICSVSLYQFIVFNLFWSLTF